MTNVSESTLPATDDKLYNNRPELLPDSNVDKYDY